MTPLPLAIWMLNATLGVTAALFLGCAAMRLCRQPAARKIIGIWSLLGCLIVVMLAAIPGVPRIPLGVVPIGGREAFDVGPLYSDPLVRAAKSSMSPPEPLGAQRAIHMSVPFSFAQWALRIYVVIVIALALRLFCGIFLVHRLIRTAAFPSHCVQTRWRNLRGLDNVELRVSSTLPRPVTAGILRQTILIPHSLCTPFRAEELDAVLLHELAHVRGRDTGILLLASTLRIFLFIHPLYWLLWYDLRLSQELLADAWAATRIGSAAAYAERLIRVAQTTRPLVAWMLPVLQAIRRRSEFYRRMHFLLEQSNATPLHAARWISFVAALTMLFVAIAGATVTFEKNNAAPITSYLSRQTIAERRGIDFLLASQEPSGGWLSPTGPGVTALAMRALLQADIPTDAPAVRRALDFIRSTRHPDGGYYLVSQPTYNTAIVIGALAKIHGGDFEKEIEDGRRFLLRLQKPQLEPNSFYSAAITRGSVSTRQIVEVDAVSEVLSGTPRSRELLVTIPGPERSDEAPVSVNGSLTYMQLKSLLYAGLTRDDPRVRALVHAVQSNFTLETNPLYDAPQGQFYFYYVASKALRAYGNDRIADIHGNSHDWRAELITRLTARQAADGSWINHASKDWLENNPVLVTTYGVLALQEARR